MALSILMAVPPKGKSVLADRFGIRREVEFIMHLAEHGSVLFPRQSRFGILTIRDFDATLILAPPFSESA
jgi:hypothetical protein